MFKKLFKFIDTQIFLLVDQIKSSSGYQQLFSPLDHFNDETQMYINRAISITITLIPFLILAVLIFLNIQTRKIILMNTEG